MASILYSDRDQAGAQNLFVIDEDGSLESRRQMTFGHDNALPSWSPDGRFLLYVSRDPVSRRTTIHLMDASNMASRQIAEGNTPEWSPDGRLIAYSDEHPGATSANIWVMRPDGGGRRQVTTGTAASRAKPSWSSDGQRIAWAEYAGTPPMNWVSIWSIGLDGADILQVTRGDAFNTDLNAALINPAPDANSPSWRHSRICFWSGIEGENGQVWTADGDGANRLQLTHNALPSHNDDPSRCPDGRILYTSDVDGRVGLWIMNGDGTGQRRICDSSAGPLPGYAAMRPEL